MLTPFQPPSGHCKVRVAYLSAREDRESSFHHCGGPVRLVQAGFYAGNT